MVLSALSHKVTNKFKSFCKTELMDRFLYACIEYFTFFFELQDQDQPTPIAAGTKGEGNKEGGGRGG